MNETIVTLDTSHIPGGMRLKAAAGWNQTEQDWARVISLEPEGCFGLTVDGHLAATTTVVCYGRDLAWIGMVLTDPACRGRGYARRLMERALEFTGRRGVAWIKLDATDMGRPLYLKLGFEDETPIERWVLPAAGGAGVSERLSAFVPDLELDVEAFGADRSAVLRSLAEEDATSLPGAGFALGRPGSSACFFGPCVARSAEGARCLLQWFLARHPGESVAWDLLPENREAARLAEEFGFERRRRLMRMARPGGGTPGAFRHDDSLVFAGAGFEYG